MPFIGISDTERAEMIKEMELNSIDDLFADIPENLLLKRDLNIEHGYSEWELIKYFDKLASKNSVAANNFKGAGCYKHHVPSLVKALCARGEFLTAYTPYQAEVSQGTLEAIYNFQNYMAELTGMDLANASMYEGATAFAEALTMSYRGNKKRPIFISRDIHPEYLEVARNYLDCLEIQYELFDSLDFVPEDATVAIQNPSFYGELMNTELLANIVKNKNLFLIAVVSEAQALSFIDKPGNWGAQIVCGSAQSFGNPLHYGGAQVGFISCKEKYIRQLPGRVIGKTTDRNGKTGFVLTFQAREQHIKRDRASSNICTNQSIHALAVAIYLSLVGEKGLKGLAKEIWTKTNALKNALSVFPNLEIRTNNCFNEFLVEVKAVSSDEKDAEARAQDLKALFSRIGVSLINFDLSFKKDDSEKASNLFLFTVSETHSIKELNQFIEDAAKIADIKTPKIERESLKKLEEEFNTKALPEINIANKSELEVCRYYTNLSHKNFSIDTNFYPLGSCTMKYNPRINDEVASSPNWTELHPYECPDYVQGALEVFDELNKSLCEITGFHRFSLQPSAGAHGEFTALLMAKQFFKDQNQERDIVFVPDSAHGTNPASASMAGFKTITVKSESDGNVDMNDLKAALDKYKGRVAVFMLTNPSTHGLFEQNINEIVKLIHDDGGLMYYDGANLNAIVGVTRPGDMGFDLVHLNLHKTFSTPHGGGGPGAGPIGANEKLAAYLPSPQLKRNSEDKLFWSFKAGENRPTEETSPHSIGRIRSFHGNFNVLLRALCYIKRNGKDGLRRIGETATLNANYIQYKISKSKVLTEEGIYSPAFDRICKHEFIVSASKLKEKYGITALDIAKRVLDKGLHAPTIYFPLTVPEAIMLEPTETEPKESLDAVVKALEEIITEAKTDEGKELIKTAPHNFEFSRFDEVKAVKEPVLSDLMEKRQQEQLINS